MIRSLFYLVYRLAWVLLLPLVLIYLVYRGRKDALYSKHLRERLTFYRQPLPVGAIWFHAVSLGELRSAVHLIRLLVARGEKVLITNFTPAGRRASLQEFEAEIAAGQVTVIWVPLDMMWTYRRFFAAAKPKIGLTLEIEVWPAMIAAAARAGVPLYMCNGQYGTVAFARDSRGLRARQRVMSGLTGVFVKSALQAERFRQVGIEDLTVTGELRFDQPVSQAHLTAGAQARETLQKDRGQIVVIASGVDDEEGVFVDLIADLNEKAKKAGVPAPLFVYVPRAPERFDAVAEKLTVAGLGVARRSVCLGEDLTVTDKGLAEDCAVLLGDSMGEMFFYLSLADRVVVGGGFIERGSHNIIEPLMLSKPVVVGPHVWNIEYPFVEAEAAGVVTRVEDGPALASVLSSPAPDQTDAIAAFLRDHSGASVKTVAAIDRVLAERGA